MAREAVSRKLAALGGTPSLRRKSDGAVFITDNGHEILDTKGLVIHDPLQFECLINGWPGVLTTGVFSLQHAHIGMFATARGVEVVDFSQSR
jgi:ribose 5-phosphate isomerase A